MAQSDHIFHQLDQNMYSTWNLHLWDFQPSWRDIYIYIHLPHFLIFTPDLIHTWLDKTELHLQGSNPLHVDQFQMNKANSLAATVRHKKKYWNFNLILILFISSTCYNKFEIWMEMKYKLKSINRIYSVAKNNIVVVVVNETGNNSAQLIAMK